MAKLCLYRFSTIEKYQNAVNNNDIIDGAFFIIEESEQLGVRKGDRDILTPDKSIKEFIDSFDWLEEE